MEATMQVITVSKHGNKFRVANNANFWSQLEMGDWEPNTFKILDRFIAGKTLIDIGAWIGPVSLYGAHLADHVYSFEPDPIAFERLQNNISLNSSLRDKISCLNMAVSTDGRKMKIFTRSHFGDSGTSMLSRGWDSGVYTEVDSVILPDFIQSQNINKLGLIKMDVEGGEFFLLPSIFNLLKQYRPNFNLSLHFPFLIEYFEKKNVSNRLVRRGLNFVGGKLGTETPKTLAKKAANDKFIENNPTVGFFINISTTKWGMKLG